MVNGRTVEEELKRIEDFFDNLSDEEFAEMMIECGHHETKGAIMVKTKILKVDADWVDVKNECRNTVNKEATSNEPTVKFKKQLLLSEHSPIRLITVKFRWEGIKSWIATHFARHWLGWDKWISTQRTDRTGVNRDEAPQDTPVNYDGKGNAQALINVGRFRLCHMASPETREQMEDLKEEIRAYEPEVSDVIVPNCIYRFGCPEFSKCGFIQGFLKWCRENNKVFDPTDIQARYDLYNEYFYERRNER